MAVESINVTKIIGVVAGYIQINADKMYTQKISASVGRFGGEMKNKFP